MKMTLLLLMGIFSMSCSRTSSKEGDASTAAAVAAPLKEGPVTPRIHVMTVDVQGRGKSETTTRDLSFLDDAYFEISLYYETAGDSVWHARRQVIAPSSLNKFHSRVVMIADIPAAQPTIDFQDPSAFIDFMAEGGYELLDQKKNEFRIDYRFRKK
jgi:hypothetical protein